MLKILVVDGFRTDRNFPIRLRLNLSTALVNSQGRSALVLTIIATDLYRYSHDCLRPPHHGLELVPPAPDRHPSRLPVLNKRRFRSPQTN